VPASTSLPASPTRPAIRSRSSPAARFVNVTARIRHGAHPATPMRYAIRCATTRVFPLPAPARMRSGPSVVVTARACSGFRRDTISAARAARRSSIALAMSAGASAGAEGSSDGSGGASRSQSGSSASTAGGAEGAGDPSALGGLAATGGVASPLPWPAETAGTSGASGAATARGPSSIVSNQVPWPSGSARRVLRRFEGSPGGVGLTPAF
jgi:hypothetical protein